MMIDKRQPAPMDNRQFMGALSIPGRMPQSESMKDQETLSAIFGALPAGSMIKALEAIGIRVSDPQEALAEDEGQNQLPSWNDRRIMLAGRDARGPMFDKSKVVVDQTPPETLQLAPYMQPGYNAGIGPLGTQSNYQGGM